MLDLASIPTAYYKSLMVEGDAQVLNNMSVAEQRKSGVYAMLNKIANEKMNANYLTTYGIGVHFHFYVTKDMTVTKPEDLKGLRFRGQPNYAAMFKHYGIAGVNIAAPEVYTALERGTVQGYGWPLWGINDFGWDKLTKIRIDPGFYNVVVNVLMNKTQVQFARAGAAQGAGRRGGLVREGRPALHRREDQGDARAAGEGRHQGRQFRSGMEKDRRRSVLGGPEEAQP